jgi:hypothetical protein
MLASPYSLYQNYAKKWSKVHRIFNSLNRFLLTPY